MWPKSITSRISITRQAHIPCVYLRQNQLALEIAPIWEINKAESITSGFTAYQCESRCYYLFDNGNTEIIKVSLNVGTEAVEGSRAV